MISACKNVHIHAANIVLPVSISYSLQSLALPSSIPGETFPNNQPSIQSISNKATCCPSLVPLAANLDAQPRQCVFPAAAVSLASDVAVYNEGVPEMSQ